MSEQMPAPAATLGDILYAKVAGEVVREGEWAALVRQVAAGDVPSLHRLYERASRPVFVLALRITGSQDAAEEVTLDVFEDAWRRAWSYNPAEGTVLGWIMNQARTRARERAQVRGAEPGAQAGAPLDDIAPKASVQSRLARRLADHLHAEPLALPPREWSEPPWDEVAPGISCKLLATDEERDRVTMLVRLDPGTEYPPHVHASREELHLLEGELLIDERVLRAGDYHRAEATTSDHLVRSVTGCACVLTTSTSDKLL